MSNGIDIVSQLRVIWPVLKSSIPPDQQRLVNQMDALLLQLERVDGLPLQCSTRFYAVTLDHEDVVVDLETFLCYSADGVLRGVTDVHLQHMRSIQSVLHEPVV